MTKRIDNEIQSFNRTKLSFSLIMLDIDNFKMINDNFGYNIGDIVLKKIVEIIMNRIRKTDILSRWGGEEFIILLPDTKTEKAVILAEEIRSQLSNMDIEKVGLVTASFGVSCYCEGDNIDTLIKKVDDLMYKAKADGRNLTRY